jgi:hypothetical protein
MGMGEFLYLQAGVGMGVGKILSGGYGCGWAIPNGFVPIAISTYDVCWLILILPLINYIYLLITN